MGGVTRVTGVTRGDRTEGGKEGKGEGGERGEEGGEEILALGRADGIIKCSTRGPRGPKNYATVKVSQRRNRTKRNLSCGPGHIRPSHSNIVKRHLFFWQCWQKL